MRVGAHQSVAGGLHRAFGHAKEDGCEALQIFTKNASQWREPSLTDAQVDEFRTARKNSPLNAVPILSHDSYLINLCAKDEALRAKSREALLSEALRCEALGVEYVVLHPGAHLGAGVDAGVSMAVEGLAWVIERSKGAAVALLVENTAGQGTCLGATFEEVGGILRGVEELAGAEGRRRSGVCLDTCHAFAAGYDLSTQAGFDAAWTLLAHEVGIGRLRALHLNDSKKGVGSKLDRHERLGEGALGLYPFWRLANDVALSEVVAVLETPPEGEDRAFRRQLELLRAFVGAPPPSPSTAALPTAFSLEVQPLPTRKTRRSKVQLSSPSLAR